jgi:hypothetical protein
MATSPALVPKLRLGTHVSKLRFEECLLSSVAGLSEAGLTEASYRNTEFSQ